MMKQVKRIFSFGFSAKCLANRRHQAGFSLLELLVAAGILGIVALGAAAQMAQMHKAYYFVKVSENRDFATQKVHALMASPAAIFWSATDTANNSNLANCVLGQGLDPAAPSAAYDDGTGPCQADTWYPLQLQMPSMTNNPATATRIAVSGTIDSTGTVIKEVFYNATSGQPCPSTETPNGATEMCPLAVAARFRATCPRAGLLSAPQTACRQAESIEIEYEVRDAYRGGGAGQGGAVAAGSTAAGKANVTNTDYTTLRGTSTSVVVPTSAVALYKPQDPSAAPISGSSKALANLGCATGVAVGVDGGGNLLCQNLNYVCPPGTITIGLDKFGRPVAGVPVNGASKPETYLGAFDSSGQVMCINEVCAADALMVIMMGTGTLQPTCFTNPILCPNEGKECDPAGNPTFNASGKCANQVPQVLMDVYVQPTPAPGALPGPTPGPYAKCENLVNSCYLTNPHGADLTVKNFTTKFNAYNSTGITDAIVNSACKEWGCPVNNYMVSWDKYNNCGTAVACSQTCTAPLVVNAACNGCVCPLTSCPSGSVLDANACKCNPIDCSPYVGTSLAGLGGSVTPPGNPACHCTATGTFWDGYSCCPSGTSYSNFQLLNTTQRAASPGPVVPGLQCACPSGTIYKNGQCVGATVLCPYDCADSNKVSIVINPAFSYASSPACTGSQGSSCASGAPLCLSSDPAAGTTGATYVYTCNAGTTCPAFNCSCPVGSNSDPTFTGVPLPANPACKCAPGDVVINGVCTPCPGGSVYSSSVASMGLDPGQIVPGTSNSCYCPQATNPAYSHTFNQFWNSANSQCSFCPNGGEFASYDGTQPAACQYSTRFCYVNTSTPGNPAAPSLAEVIPQTASNNQTGFGDPGAYTANSPTNTHQVCLYQNYINKWFDVGSVVPVPSGPPDSSGNYPTQPGLFVDCLQGPYYNYPLASYSPDNVSSLLCVAPVPTPTPTPTCTSPNKTCYLNQIPAAQGGMLCGSGGVAVFGPVQGFTSSSALGGMSQTACIQAAQNDPFAVSYTWGYSDNQCYLQYGSQTQISPGYRCTHSGTDTISSICACPQAAAATPVPTPTPTPVPTATPTPVPTPTPFVSAGYCVQAMTNAPGAVCKDATFNGTQCDPTLGDDNQDFNGCVYHLRCVCPNPTGSSCGCNGKDEPVGTTVTITGTSGSDLATCIQPNPNGTKFWDFFGSTTPRRTTMPVYDVGSFVDSCP